MPAALRWYSACLTHRTTLRTRAGRPWSLKHLVSLIAQAHEALDASTGDCELW